MSRIDVHNRELKTFQEFVKRILKGKLLIANLSFREEFRGCYRLVITLRDNE